MVTWYCKSERGELDLWIGWGNKKFIQNYGGEVAVGNIEDTGK
jgi:hypothetical protein